MKSLRFRAIFRYTMATQTFMDPCGPQHVYAPHYYPLHHRQSYDRFSPSPQHHICFTPLYSPVICKDYLPLVYMYKSGRYYLVFDIDLGSIFVVIITKQPNPFT